MGSRKGLSPRRVRLARRFAGVFLTAASMAFASNPALWYNTRQNGDEKSEFKDCNLYGLTDEEREIVKGGEK